MSDTRKIEDIISRMEILDFKNPWNWYKMYELINEIETGKLYEQGYVREINGEKLRFETKSMTAWINSYADNHSISKARIFVIKTAGEILKDYMIRHNLAIEDLSETSSIAPQTLANIKKIISLKIKKGLIKEENKKKELDFYINRGLKGELTRDKSNEEYKRIKKSKSNTYPYVEKVSFASKRVEANDIVEVKEADIAPKKPDVLFWDKSWLAATGNTKRNLYKVLDNFPLPLEELARKRSHKVVFENIQTLNSNQLNVHLIINEKKASEYPLDALSDFFDYIWILESHFAHLFEPFFKNEHIGVLYSDKYSKGVKLQRGAKKNRNADTKWAMEKYILTH